MACVLAARNRAKLEALAARLPRAVACPGDMTDPAMPERLVTAALEGFGRLDVVFNNAGVLTSALLTMTRVSDFDSLMAVNARGTFLVMQQATKQMVRKRAGRIINCASIMGRSGAGGHVAYSAAKAAIANFTQWLAVHMATEYTPAIRVNAIAPGFFLTNQNRFLLTDEKTGALTPRGKTVTEHTPMGRFGSPDELLGAMFWLLSDASTFVTGVTIPVDGGFSAFSGV